MNDMEVDQIVEGKAPLKDLLELKLKGLTNEQIGNKYGVTFQAISKRIRGIFKLLDKENLQAYKENKVHLLTAVEQELLDNILNPDKIKKATLGNIAYAFDKVYQANRLEQGLSTENVAYSATITKIDDRSSEITRLKQLLNIQEVEGTYQIQPDNDTINDDVLPPNESQTTIE